MGAEIGQHSTLKNPTLATDLSHLLNLGSNLIIAEAPSECLLKMAAPVACLAFQAVPLAL